MDNMYTGARGCGSLRAGKSYLQGGMGPGGRLKAWAWLLSRHIEGDKDNLLISSPARQVRIINLPASIVAGRIIYPEQTEKITALKEIDLAEGLDLFERLPQNAVLDHVGSKYYTPYSFAAECEAHGPSRCMPRQVVKEIAPYLPCPIVFTHSSMPIMAGESVSDIFDWAVTTLAHDTLKVSDAHSDQNPVWFNKEWGLYRNDKNGSDHMLTLILEAISWAALGKDKPLYSVMPAPLYDQVMYVEQPFGVSWLNRAVYIQKGDETEDDLKAIEADGLIPVSIDDPVFEGDENDGED